MRVISGKYKGRKLLGYDIDGTRPTMDRVKESLFAIIQNEVKDSLCLDLFAGTGALGIEALSNGAKTCYFIDNNKEIIKILDQNLSNLQIKEEYHVVKNDYLNAFNFMKEHELKFDLIFLDPPYPNHLINKCLELILRYELLNPNGQVICEFETEVLKTSGYEILKDKKYGSKRIVVLKRG